MHRSTNLLSEGTMFEVLLTLMPWSSVPTPSRLPRALEIAFASFWAGMPVPYSVVRINPAW